MQYKISVSKENNIANKKLTESVATQNVAFPITNTRELQRSKPIIGFSMSTYEL